MCKVTEAAEVIHGEGNENKIVVIYGFDARLRGAKLVSCCFVMNGMGQVNGWVIVVQFIKRRRARDAQISWCGRGRDGNIKAKSGVRWW